MTKLTSLPDYTFTNTFKTDLVAMLIESEKLYRVIAL